MKKVQLAIISIFAVLYASSATPVWAHVQYPTPSTTGKISGNSGGSTPPPSPTPATKYRIVVAKQYVVGKPVSNLGVIKVAAASSASSGFNSQPAPASQTQQSSGGGGSTCGSTQTHLITCDSQTGVGAIGDLIKVALGVTTLLTGLAATGGLAYAGTLYASARDNSVKVGQAKSIVGKVALGLLLYGFTVAIINWLIPGGVIG